MVIFYSMVVGFETIQTKIQSILRRRYTLSGIWRETRPKLDQIQREWVQSFFHYLDYEARMVTLVVEEQAPLKKSGKATSNQNR